eukprot:364318-Chlamydomonas_euryale.AAC.2
MCRPGRLPGCCPARLLGRPSPLGWPDVHKWLSPEEFALHSSQGMLARWCGAVSLEKPAAAAAAAAKQHSLRLLTSRV